MQSAKLWVNGQSGEVAEVDQIFLDWLGASTAPEAVLDDLLTPVDNDSTSMLAQIHEQLQLDELQYLKAKPTFKLDHVDQMLCFINVDKQELNGVLPLTLFPVKPSLQIPEDYFNNLPPELFDSITDFILLCAPDFTIRRANVAAKSVYGGFREIEGEKCYTILRGKDSPCKDCPLPQTLAKGTMVPMEYYDSSTREFLETRTYPHVDNGGYWTGFTLINRVISHRREQEGETVQNKKLQALGRMASGIAHDFNNMLAIILGQAQLLKAKMDDSLYMKNLQTIEKAAIDSTDIIRRLQDFTRKRDQDDHPAFEEINVNALLDDVVNYATTRTSRLQKQRGVHIKFETQFGDVNSIEGNKSHLRSALLNMVLNAIDALEIGGVISIWTQQLGNRVEIGIEDTGIGMSKEVQERIFDPFFTTKGEKGNGLGLSEVYGIINQHNGSIEVESTLGEGTTMLLYLPILHNKSQS